MSEGEGKGGGTGGPRSAFPDFGPAGMMRQFASDRPPGRATPSASGGSTDEGEGKGGGAGDPRSAFPGAFPGFDPAGMMERFAKLSGASVEMWSAWGRTWESVLRGRAWPVMEASLRRASAPGTGRDDAHTVGEILERAFEMPRLADLIGVDQKAFRVLEPPLELLSVGRDYALLAGQVWTEAARRFQARLDEARKQGKTFDSAGEVLDVWNAIVDESLIEFNRSGHFADLQQRFVRATMRYRLEQRQLAERVCEFYDLPTRTEVDALHRRTHELQREVRRLRRALAAAEGAGEGGKRDQRQRSRSAAG